MIGDLIMMTRAGALVVRLWVFETMEGT